MQTTLSPAIIATLVVIAIFDLVLRGFAMWMAAGNKQKGWFIALMIFSTAGVLPLVFMKFYGNQENN